MSQDVHATLAISALEAGMGTARVLTLPDGQQVTISVPAGAYNGQELRFPGQVPASSASEQPGTLIITLNVVDTQEQTTLHTPASASPTEQTALVGSSPEQTLVAPAGGSDVQAAGSSPEQTIVASASGVQAPPPGAAPAPGQMPQAPVPAPTAGQFGLAPAPGAPLPAQPGRAPNWQQPYYAPMYQPPRQQPVISVKMIVLIVLAFLLVSGSVGIFFVVRGVQASASAHATATSLSATNAVDATSTAQVSADLTAQANASTAVARATASVVASNPNPYAPGLNKLVFIDKMDGSNDNNGWPTDTGCAYQGGSYQVSINQAGHVHGCWFRGTSSIDFKDFTLEAKVKILKGDNGGFTFRGSSMLFAGYMLSIDTKGYCQLLFYGVDGGSPKRLTGAHTSALRQGLNQWNTVAVVAQGSSITWYINGQQVGSISDSQADSGELGLVAGTYVDSGATSAAVAYSNVRIWTN